MTFWSVHKHSGMIERQEIYRRTAKFVFDSRGRREAIESAYSRYFEDRDAAVTYARELLESRLLRARKNVEIALADIQRFEERENGR